MKNLKKLLALTLAGAMLALSVTACGNESGSADKGGTADGSAAAEQSGGGDNVITVGYCGPFTGSLGEFTQAFDWDSKLCLDKMNETGYDIGGQHYTVKVVTADTASTAATASEVAKKLITEDKVDILIGAWTPENTAPVAAVAEQYGVPCLCSNSPYESWTATFDPEWSYGLMFSVDDIVNGYVSALVKLKDQTNGKVGFLFDSDVDGVTFSSKLQPLLEAEGFEVYDPGRFSVDTTDYTSIIKDLQAQDCDIVCGNQILPNFMTAWKQFNENNYIPKAIVLGKGLCYGTDFMALDPLPDGIMCEIEFAKTMPYYSELLGMSCEDLANYWEEEQGTQFPVCSFGYDIAQWEVIDAALKNCEEVSPEAIREAIGSVDIDTIYGHIAFTECDGQVAKCPIVCGQWFPSEEWEDTYDFNIVGNGDYDDIEDTDPYIIPNTTQD